MHSYQSDALGGDNKNQESVREKVYSPGNEIMVPERFLSGIAEPNAGSKDFAEDANPFEFQVCVTQNGSMMQDIFYEYCVNFCKHLPEGHGKGGILHILFFNGHAI